MPESDAQLSFVLPSAHAKLSADTSPHRIMLSALGSGTAGMPAATHSAAPRNSYQKPKVLISYMVWDKITVQGAAHPHGYDRGYEDYYSERRRSTATLQMALRQDMQFSDLLMPKCHASVSQSLLKQHREYIAQRKRSDAFCFVL